jgi:ABC transport system ATP-binding/permease protein
VAILIDLQHVVLQGTERAILEDLTLTVSSGDRIGVVGINGTGKSTLLNIMAGVLDADAGSILRGRDVHVGHLPQNPVLPDGTVREILGEGWEVDAALDRLGMMGALDTQAKHLSGGQLKRVALARLFAQPNDLIIMDEPTNHLDLNAIEWLEQQITSFPGGVVLVSHDRFLLDQVTNRMVEIDRGKTFLHTGGYAKLLETQAEREAQAQSAEQTRKNMARRELAWLRRGAKARSTKPQARIDAAERLLKSGPQAAARGDSIDFEIEAPRLGNMVMKAHNVNFSYPNGVQMLRDINLELGPGDRIGIVGPNGAGKSTFINVLAQRLEPTTGTIKHGPSVVASYFEQHGGDFDAEKTVQELVAGPHGTPGCQADLAVMKNFWFTGALTKTKAKDLSGGERRRLQLLLALTSRPNVLFLDEPTNDLDLETIRLIEDFLSQWTGTLIVVSHDRTFLSRTTDRLLEVHPDGTVRDVPGGIDAWLLRHSGAITSATSKALDVSGASDATPATEGGVSKGRLLRDLEKEVNKLERKRGSLGEKIANSADPAEQTRLSEELSGILKDLAEAEDRWLQLNES